MSAGLQDSSAPVGRFRSVLANGPYPDAVTVLTIYLFLVFAVPSDLTIGALGAAGSPAAIWGLLAALWWCWYQIQRVRLRQQRPTQPVRIAMFCFLAANLASYAAANLRPLPTVEGSQADSGLIKVLSWMGILLLACDGIPDLPRLHSLLRRLVLMSGLFAALGLLQFATGQSLISWINLPGFNSTQTFSNVQVRGGFTRSAATAIHPLEYGMVLCMALPISINLALHDRDRSLLTRWWPGLLMAVASVLSVSRSALLGVAAGLILLVPTWSRSTRRWVAAMSVVLIAGVYVLVPGMVTTLRSLFSGVGEDSSTSSRTDSYGLVGDFFSRSPWFGRGTGTFLPQYRILDNQYLQSLVETGLVGVLALLSVVGTSVYSALRARRSLANPYVRDISQSLIASIIAGATVMAFFDAFSFPKAGQILFFVAGLCGSYGALCAQENDRESPVVDLAH